MNLDMAKPCLLHMWRPFINPSLVLKLQSVLESIQTRILDNGDDIIQQFRLRTLIHSSNATIVEMYATSMHTDGHYCLSLKPMFFKIVSHNARVFKLVTCTVQQEVSHHALFTPYFSLATPDWISCCCCGQPFLAVISLSAKNWHANSEKEYIPYGLHDVLSATCLS